MYKITKCNIFYLSVCVSSFLNFECSQPYNVNKQNFDGKYVKSRLENTPQFFKFQEVPHPQLHPLSLSVSLWLNIDQLAFKTSMCESATPAHFPHLR